MPLSAGARLGPYEILSPIGAGGMGEVYRAVDTRLGRSVAIKVLPEQLTLQSERLHRFEKEARAASSLNHPNIVTIYEVGSSDTHSYIAMELVEGKTVRELLHAGSVPLRKLLTLAAQVADGLAKAHEAGIVHRDLKPENLMVTRDGFAKILDFGLAKLTQAGEEPSNESGLATMTKGTVPGVVMGTAGYMSPEQASGRVLDFRSDQFSFGSILYEMATGRRAFERATTVQTLSAIIDDEPDAVGKVNPKLPANFCWIVERCLTKEPEGRYAATRDLARDLATLRDHSSEISTVTDLPVLTRRKRKRLQVAGGIAAILAIAAAALLVGDRLGERKGLLAPFPVFRQLTFRRGFITGARFTPDGQTVVYSASWDGEPSEIFTARLDSPESRALGISPAGILAISSAGEMAIGLGCEDRWDPCYGTLARVPLAGGAPREVLEDVSSADWSPDGKDLAVIHVVNGKYRLEYPIGKVLYETSGALTALRLSPNGQLMSFIEHGSRDRNGGIVSVVDRQGHRRALTPEWRALFGTAWAPDSSGVAFAGNPSNVRMSLNFATLSGEVRALARWPGTEQALDISRDGNVLVRTGYSRSEIISRTEGGLPGQKVSLFDWSASADLSADGRSLLFSEFGEGVGGRSTTFLRRLDGSEPARLGEGKAMALSPDQKWALVALDQPTHHLALLPTRTGQPRELPGGGIFLYHWAIWFPNGRRIVFAGEQKDRLFRTYIQDVDGGMPDPFGEEGLRISVVSPDGKRLAGTTLDGQAFQFSADGDGKDPQPIPGVEPGEFLAQWGADGDSLYVRGAEENPLTLYRVDLRTGKRSIWKQLRPLEDAGFLEFGAGPRSGVCLTRDAQTLVYSYWTRQNDLYLVDGLQHRWQ